MITARETQTSLFLTLMLYLTAAAGQFLYSAVRVGDEVTLSCDDLIYSSDHCHSITWMFTNNSRSSITLFEKGQISEAAATKSDRLRATSDCSLVIKKVSVEDVGQYVCRCFNNGQQVPDSHIIMSVVHMVEQKQKDKLILNCSVTDFSRCRHTVEWLNEGGEEMLSDMEEPDQSCSVTVTIPTSDRNWKVKMSEVLKCKVTNTNSNKEQLFDFRIQSSGGKTDKRSTAKTTTTTISPRITSTKILTTSKMTTTKLPATSSTTAKSNKFTSMAINSSTNINHFSKTPGWSMVYIIGPAVIIVIILVIVGWKKTRVLQTSQSVCRSLVSMPLSGDRHADYQKTDKNKTKKEEERATDPEDGVLYASITQTKQTKKTKETKNTKETKKKPRIPDSVTYSTLNISSSAAAAAQATIDLDHLYSTVSK